MLRRGVVKLVAAQIGAVAVQNGDGLFVLRDDLGLKIEICYEVKRP